MPRFSFVTMLFVGCIGSNAIAQTTAADHTFERAGYPNSIARWARPSQKPKYSLGYIGRATVFDHDCEPRQAEGVIGYDYVGYGPYSRVFPGWVTVGSPPGPYRTDGPRIFDIFSIRPLRRALNKETGEEHAESRE